LATELQEALISRRISKDNVALHLGMVEFVNSDVGKNAIKALQQRLGDARKVESKMDGRRFMPRQTENTSPVNEEQNKNVEKLIQSWNRSTKSKH
jgi:hypothetical protein